MYQHPKWHLKPGQPVLHHAMPIHPHPKPERGLIQVPKPKNPAKKANPASLLSRTRREVGKERGEKHRGKKGKKQVCHAPFFLILITN
jgi:hypothetical protein